MMMSVYTYSGWVCGRERPLLQIGSIIKFSLDILKLCYYYQDCFRSAVRP